MRPRLRHLASLALVAVTVAGCASTSEQASRIALAALATTTPQLPPSSPSSTTLCTASLRPPTTQPAPGHMPARSFMATIRKRGYLIAGVDAGLLDFGYLNPNTGKIEGFEIDLVNDIAAAIFGTAKGHVQLVSLTVPQRIPFVQQSTVDIVVDAITMTCSRSKQVDFSAVYYDAKQRVLVPSNSSARSITDLAGKKVCASATSTPVSVMRALPSSERPDVVQEPQAIDCLVELQEGQIAGISTDSSILLGFQAQDPNTIIVGPSLGDVPYGMAINKNHPDFVRFVNGVLAKLERNGTWQHLQAKWLGQFHQLEAPPKPEYDG
jgi:polar amino acid transport system substrate-binding protein